MLKPRSHTRKRGSPPIDQKLESERRESSLDFAQPHIQRILRNGAVIWQEGDAAPTINAGETLVIEGTNLGAGTDIDYSKVVVGKSRVFRK